MSVLDFPLLRDDVNTVIQEAVLDTLEGVLYQHNKVNEWTNTIMKSCVDQFAKLSPNFKYVVTCFIKQKNGGGLCSYSVCYWDEKADGACKVRWENDTIACVIVVFGIAI